MEISYYYIHFILLGNQSLEIALCFYISSSELKAYALRNDLTFQILSFFIDAVEIIFTAPLTVLVRIKDAPKALSAEPVLLFSAVVLLGEWCEVGREPLQ